MCLCVIFAHVRYLCKIVIHDCVFYLLLELQSSISKFSQQCDEHVKYKASLEEKMETLNSQLAFVQKSNNQFTEEVHDY